MRKLITLLLFIAVATASCNSYGDKLNINDKSEVYYKEGASKEDAKKLGDYLLKNNYFDTKSQKTVQLTKTKDTFNVKFVVDKTLAEKEASSIESTFTAFGMLLSLQVFDGKPTKVKLADKYLETFREIPVQTLGKGLPDNAATGNSDSANISK
jgi:hypothetical protein